jgi:toxin ParE1/3/4
MSQKYEVRYLSTAQRDLREIFDYIQKDNPSAAVAQLEEFDKAIARLEMTPLLGVIPKDERLRRLGYRMLIVGQYLVFYIVRGNIVQIRRVIHGARQYQFLI